MPKRLFFLMFVAVSLLASGQQIRLTKYRAPLALYLDPSCLYNYNRYEGSRLDLSLIAVFPNEASEAARDAKHFFSSGIYGAYGFVDKDFKFGGSLGYYRKATPNNPRPWSISLWGAHDLEPAASRNLGTYNIITIADNSSYLSSRYVGVNGCSLLFNKRFGKLKLATSLRLSWEDYRFDNYYLIYPFSNSYLKDNVKRFEEAKVRLDWCPKPKNNGLTLQIRGGLVHDDAQRAYISSLLQYDADLGISGLHLFGQAGYASSQAPYSRMFDLSGTAFSHYFFRHNFLTVSPNTFASNAFAHICLNYTTPEPIWKSSWSNPHPFIQVNAMIGRLHDADEMGLAVVDGISLKAPDKGLLEPAAGLDGLIRWGLLDVGFGVAYQVSPSSATYYRELPKDRFAFTMVFNFIIDKYIY